MDEVTTLRRELELLKLQLEQERKKNATALGKDDTKDDLASTQQDATKRHVGEANKTAVVATSSQGTRTYVQHTAVGARRGKWWLRDRQVVSRGDCGLTLKVRETWIWSGRTVILDKIVQVDEKLKGERADLSQAEEEKAGNDLPADEVVSSSAQQSAGVETSGTTRGEVFDSKAVQPLTKADDEERRSSVVTSS